MKIQAKYDSSRNFPRYKWILLNSNNVFSFDQHIIKAIATEPSMLTSDIAIKEFIIQDRAQSPILFPAPGKFYGDLNLIILCQDDSSQDSKIYYTTVRIMAL